MALEIERKYLLKRIPNISWTRMIEIKQYYLQDGTRIRSSFLKEVGSGDFEYVKCKKTLLSKNPKVYDEQENIISKEEFDKLLGKAKTGLMKTRLIKKVSGGLKWEVDVYEDFDLIVAEIEIPSKKYIVSVPKFIKDVLVMEVTEFSQFSNRNLSDKIINKKNTKTKKNAK